jgi:hypothetical protein
MCIFWKSQLVDYLGWKDVPVVDFSYSNIKYGYV